MRLKGFDKFREKTPILKGRRIVIIPFYILSIIFVTFYLLLKIYSLPDILIDQYPTQILLLLPFLGVLLFELLGLILVSQMWIWRTKLKKKYGSTSYQRIFPIGLAGIIIIISLAFNVFVNLQDYSPIFWQRIENLVYNKSVYQLFDTTLAETVHIIQISCGLLILILGMSISMRSVLTFGFDYTTVIYLYFPEESVIKENQIYSVVRHPMYSGMVLVAFGGFVYNLSIYSFLLFVVYVVCFYFHVNFVEEPELLERFGQDYELYKKNVPPFYFNPLKFGKLMKFVLSG